LLVPELEVLDDVLVELVLGTKK
jgi:hypothetical protein